MNSTLQSIRAIIEEENLFQGESVDTIQRLEGGLINFTYRVTLQDNSKSYILKYYPPYIASIPDVPLSSSRYSLKNMPYKDFLKSSNTFFHQWYAIDKYY